MDLIKMKIPGCSFSVRRAGKAKRAERSGLPWFFFGYFLCIRTKKVKSI